MRSHTVRRALLGVALALGVLAVVALGWHVAAWSAYRASWTAGAPAFRLARARTAERLEPFNREFRSRALWMQGADELARGDYNAAVETLGAAYRLDLGDVALRQEFRRAQAIQAGETNRKAHLQHGHEGPGGALTPEDIER